MKVKPKPGTEDGWLSSGVSYVVLGISASSGKVQFRILSPDQHTPALFSAENFDIVESNISARWTVQILEDGKGFNMEPAAWLCGDFWDAYFDGDVTAASVFAREYEALLDEAAHSAASGN